MSRYDSIGLFWEDRPAQRVTSSGATRETRSAAPRVAPPVPNTGWQPPAEFPNLETAKFISIDVETRDPRIRERGPGAPRGDGYVCGLAIGATQVLGGAVSTWYFPFAHERGFNFEREHVLAWARRELTRKGQPKVGANLLYDLQWLAHEGVKVEGPFLDVQVAEPLIDENSRQYNLEALMRKYLDEGKVQSVLYDWCSRAFGGNATRREQAANIWRAPAELVGPYAESDVRGPLLVLARQLDVIRAEKLDRVWDTETRLIPMLLAMRMRGVRVNVPGAQRLHEDLTAKIAHWRERVGQVDINSAQDIEAYCKSRSIAYPKTEKGNPSFDQEFLSRHSDPVLQGINRLRKYHKIRDVFVEGYILNMEHNGRVYCQFNQLKGDEYGTVSGRFSSSDPNLQNIPSRDDELAPLVRSLFVPDDGDRWGTLDESQIEFRLLLHYAQGPKADTTRELYWENPTEDFHAMVAKLTDLDRKPAKNINFGLVYGMGEPTMAARLGRPLDEVRPLFDQYHEKLPFVKYTYNEVSRVAANRGYIMTLLGRRRRFHLWSPAGVDGAAALPHDQCAARYPNKMLRRAFTHKALNALLQGGSADRMKQAMVRIWDAGVCDVLGAPLSTVHDELNWSVPYTTQAREAFFEAAAILENSIPLRVPTVVNYGFGPNWWEAK